MSHVCLPGCPTTCGFLSFLRAARPPLLSYLQTPDSFPSHLPFLPVSSPCSFFLFLVSLLLSPREGGIIRPGPLVVLIRPEMKGW